MDYAIEITSTPVDVPDALFEALRAQLDEAQLLELTYTIGYENYRARTAHALDIGPAGFSEGAACAVPYRAERRS